MRKYSDSGRFSGGYTSRYAKRGYGSRRNSIKRKLILACILVVLILAVVGVLVTYFAKVEKERKEQQLSYRQEGITYYEQGDYERALDCFEKALADSKGKIGDVEMDICFYKARTQYELGDAEGALKTYQAVIDYKENPKAYFLRGTLHYDMGAEAKALADYNKAVEMEKEDYELYFSIYNILVSKDQVEEGQKILKKALDIRGNKASDKVKKGHIHYLLGENEKAIGLLEDVAKEETEAYYYLFLVYDSMENEEKALELMNTYMEKEENPDSYQLYEMGSSLLKKDMYDDAVRCFTKALALEKVPNKQNIMRNLVVTYEKQKDFTSAKEVMEQYIKEYPEDEEALREYIFLQTR
jgi:tetratricopeptide (TPR) repeat protein